MNPALVTGGCGFVGRHTVLRLVQEGKPVWIVDDLSSGKPPDSWLPSGWKERILDERVRMYAGDVSVVCVQADIRDFLREHLDPNRSGLSRVVGEHPQFGDVYHLAAVVGGRTKIEGDPMMVAIDLSIDAEFFNWAVRARPERILYASSSAVYPIDLQTAETAAVLREDHVRFDSRLGLPDMTYGWSKLTGEYLARLAASHYGLHIAVVRPFSGYGEDQDLTYPVPAIATRAARREDPLVVWGSGRQGRDFVHIDDCVEAMCLALATIRDGSAVNIGSGRLVTFLEVAEILAGIAGYRPKIVPLADKPAGVHARYADTSLAIRLLGWRPRISLTEGLARVYHARLAEIAQSDPLQLRGDPPDVRR